MPGKGSGSREVRPHFTEQRNYTNTIPASAEKSSGANSWLRNLGYAAAAIIAALSVESGRDGKYTGRPSMAASRSKRWRNSLFAATPPVTNNVAESQVLAAVRDLATRSSTIVR